MLAAVRQREYIGEGGRLYARQGTHCLFDLAIEVDSLGFRVAKVVEIQIDGEQMRSIESGIERLRLLRTPDENARGGQHENRRGDLRHDQELAQARCASTGCGVGAACRGEILVGSAQRRQQSCE